MKSRRVEIPLLINLWVTKPKVSITLGNQRQGLILCGCYTKSDQLLQSWPDQCIVELTSGVGIGTHLLVHSTGRQVEDKSDHECVVMVGRQTLFNAHFTAMQISFLGYEQRPLHKLRLFLMQYEKQIPIEKRNSYFMQGLLLTKGFHSQQ